MGGGNVWWTNRVCGKNNHKPENVKQKGEKREHKGEKGKQVSGGGYENKSILTRKIAIIFKRQSHEILVTCFFTK